MSWIKLETHTFDKVEVYAIAQELGIDSDAVIGKCCRVWAWFDVNTVDGVTLSVTSALLDRYCGVTGFTQAMINAGWMRDDGQFLMLPNYDRHNSKTAKSRALGAIRQSNFKSNAQGNAEGNATADDQALPKSSHREEKRREEKNIEPLSSKHDLVSVLQHLNEKANRDFQPVAANLKLIQSRLKEGATVETCKKVIDSKVAEWLNDKKMVEYLRPATLFNATNFAQYVGQLPKNEQTKREWQEGERNGDLIYEKWIGWRKLTRIELIEEQKAKELEGENNAGN
jgi:uncharacterized phage protein (TIGR02220 family)